MVRKEEDEQERKRTRNVEEKEKMFSMSKQTWTGQSRFRNGKQHGLNQGLGNLAK